MSDLREYSTGIVRDLVPPDLGVLVRVAQRRRTTRNAATLTAAVVGVLAVAILVGAPGQRRAAETPAKTPTATATSAADWTAEEIIARGTVLEQHRYDNGVGPEVKHWRRCAAAAEDSCRTAIEIIGPDGRRIAVGTDTPLMARTTYAGNGYFLVRVGSSTQWLASASMKSPRPVTVASGSVPPTPGISWVDAPNAPCPCVLDIASAVLTPIELPAGGVMWAKGTSGGFWGMTGASNGRGDLQSFDAFWVAADGSLQSHVLVSEAPRQLEFADGGLRGEMAFYDEPMWPAPDNPQHAVTLLHISTDRGATWQTRIVPDTALDDRDARRLAEDWQAWPHAKH